MGTSQARGSLVPEWLAVFLIHFCVCVCVFSSWNFTILPCFFPFAVLSPLIKVQIPRRKRVTQHHTGGNDSILPSTVFLPSHKPYSWARFAIVPTLGGQEALAPHPAFTLGTNTWVQTQQLMAKDSVLSCRSVLPFPPSPDLWNFNPSFF